MRYLVTGRVHPERAAVTFDTIVWQGPDGAHIQACCDASQLTIGLDIPGMSDSATAKIAAEDYANIVVGALGFTLASSYSVEAIHVADLKGVSTIFGVRIPDLMIPREEVRLENVVALATQDTFLRLALRDYVRALNDATDCAAYCYRAIEALKSAFALQFGGEGWAHMHAALGSTREHIDTTVKHFADPIRHGNWVEAPKTDGAQRLEMLRTTRDLLVSYIKAKAPNNALERP